MPQNNHGVFLHIKIVLPRMPLPLHTRGLQNVQHDSNLKWPRICGIHVDESGGLALMKYPEEEEEEELGVKVVLSC